jgi:hypothetical protein
MQHTDWLLVEVAAHWSGKSLLAKTGFDTLGRDQSSLRLSVLAVVITANHVFSFDAVPAKQLLMIEKPEAATYHHQM